mgnify:FL=1
MHTIWRKAELAAKLNIKRQSLDYRIKNDPAFPEPFGTSPDGSAVYWCPDLQPDVLLYVTERVSQGRGRMSLR